MGSYLGLDLSLTGTGFFLIKQDGTTDFCEIKTKPKDFPSLIRRTKFIAEKILERLGKEKPELVLLEDYFIGMGSSGDTVKSLACLGTIVRDRLLQAGLSYIALKPSQIKKFETGKGVAPKDNMLKEVFKHHGLDTSSNNIADACAMAYMCKGYCQWLKGERDFLKFQLEVLKGIKDQIEPPYEKDK